MKRRILLLLLLFVCLTGCTIRDDITVNYDGKVIESVEVLQNNSIIDNQSLENIVDNKIKNYSTILEHKNYEYEIVRHDSYSGARVYKTYDNICDYFGNSAFNQYVYKYMDCTETDEYYEITNATEHIAFCDQCSNWPSLDDVEFKITLPISATDQNADESTDNTYIWKYDKDTSNDKKFYLKISKSKLKEAEKKYNEEQERKERIKRIIMISIVAIVLIVIVSMSFYLYKKYKNNKIDYS